MVYGNITGEFPRIRYRYQRIGGKFSFFGWCCYPYRENLVTLLENSREFGTSTRELTGNFHFLVGTTGKILYWKKYQNRYGENLVPKIGIYTYKYNIGGRPSDNFEATRRAHSSFWSFLPIVLGEHIKIGITFEIVGPRPWSEIIQICVLKKNLF